MATAALRAALLLIVVASLQGMVTATKKNGTTAVQRCISRSSVITDGIPGGPGPEPLTDPNGPCRTLFTDKPDYELVCSSCLKGAVRLHRCLYHANCKYTLTSTQFSFFAANGRFYAGVIDECNRNGYNRTSPTFSC